ncbi:MAG TPA: CHAD domain-containing protein [Candidatus Binataceae bacterium]|nr:CHAD domain-containing protein [Candidatus Binataceae bacterium]
MPAVRRSARAHPAAPSSTDPAAQVAAAAIAVQLRAMNAEQAGAVSGEVEAIHRLRVATRRLRAALRMLREVVPSDEAESAADELGWLCGAIGAVRDLDVLAQMLEDRATRLEAEFIRALAPLSGTIRRQRAIEQERLVAALDSERFRGLVQRLGTVASEPDADSVTLGAVAARLVRPQLRAMLRAGAGLDEASPPETLHRLRVRVKKLRYALEPFRAVGGKPTRKMLRRLERVQERVGLYHDAATAAAWLRGWATEAHDAPPAALMAAGALIHSLERRLRRLRVRSLKAWRRADMDELARAVLYELNRAAAQARRAAKPPLALVPVVRAS